MDIQGILEKIEADAKEAASQALLEAQKKADAIRAQGEAQAQRQRLALQERLQADRAELEGRMLRMAELEDKKAQLAVKRQVMDDAFALAVDKLRRLPEEEKRAFFREQLLSTARGDEELFIGQEENAWFSDAFLADLNAALAAAGKPGCLKKGGSVDGCGFELRQGGEAQRCTFEALVEGSRMALEGDVARVLFQE